MLIKLCSFFYLYILIYILGLAALHWNAGCWDIDMEKMKCITVYAYIYDLIVVIFKKVLVDSARH